VQQDVVAEQSYYGLKLVSRQYPATSRPPPHPSIEDQYPCRMRLSPERAEQLCRENGRRYLGRKLLQRDTLLHPGTRR
jgi:hypothetical protein